MVTGGYQKYQQNSVMTASAKELILMLYNGAIKFCNLALEGCDEENYQKQHNALIRAQDIITELQLALDHTVEVSKSIDQLYSYIKEVLVKANIQKDREGILEAKSLIIEFRNLWQELMKVA